MRTTGLWTAVLLSILTVALPGIGWGRASAAEGSRISGTSGVVSWEVVDILQTTLPEEQAVRWDFVVVLTAVRSLRLERFEVSVGGSRVSSKFERRLDAKGEVRVHHWDRTRSGDGRMVVRRWYYGKDDAGNPVTVEIRFDLDSTIGVRSVPASAVRVASPTAGVPLPWDARIVPTAARGSTGVAGFSGVWIGKWNSVTDHVLVVEEVGARDALVTYAWGRAQAVPQPGWVRSRAQVRQKQLTLGIGTAVVTYRALEDGRLYGVWRRGTEAATVRLVRQPVGPSQPVAANAAPAVRAGSLAREAWQDLLDDRYADALPKALEALALREQLLGPDHLEVAASLNTLGEIYRRHGRFDDAERVHRRALTIREKHLGPGDPDVAASLNNLAMLHNARAVYAEAESLLKRALRIVEEARDMPLQNRRLEAEILENLAKVYRALGRIAEAEQAQTKAMMLWTTQ